MTPGKRTSGPLFLRGHRCCDRGGKTGPRSRTTCIAGRCSDSPRLRTAITFLKESTGHSVERAGSAPRQKARAAPGLKDRDDRLRPWFHPARLLPVTPSDAGHLRDPALPNQPWGARVRPGNRYARSRSTPTYPPLFCAMQPQMGCKMFRIVSMYESRQVTH